MSSPATEAMIAHGLESAAASDNRLEESRVGGESPAFVTDDAKFVELSATGVSLLLLPDTNELTLS
jgi:hypothetical protein